MSFMNTAELKSTLKRSTAPRLGRFGEKIYAMAMIKQGYDIQTLHKEKADFFVQGLGRVDVKTKGFGRPSSRSLKRVPNTTYCFVDLHDEHIALSHEDAAGRTLQPTEFVTWDQAVADWNELNYRLASVKSDLAARILLQTSDLKDWIERNWRQRAAIVYREGRETQKSMTSGKKPWGPITFYEWPTAKRIIDLKVLAYFDGDKIYQIMAYPIRLREEIAWTHGRTKEGTMSFDPRTVPSKFVFSDVEDFKLNFPKRFMR